MPGSYPQNSDADREIDLSRDQSNKAGEDLRAVRQIAADIVTDVGDLFEDYFHLAQAQMTKSAQEVKRRTVRACIGASLITVATIYFLLTITDALLRYSNLPPWACYGILGVVTTIAGALFLQRRAPKARSPYVFDTDPEVRPIH